MRDGLVPFLIRPAKKKKRGVMEDTDMLKSEEDFFYALEHAQYGVAVKYVDACLSDVVKTLKAKGWIREDERRFGKVYKATRAFFEAIHGENL